MKTQKSSQEKFNMKTSFTSSYQKLYFFSRLTSNMNGQTKLSNHQ